ncbi:MAG: hypothetical protein VB051_06455 [Candidatus Pelethousia sp.]|nr:hypothetical protein [Candidatus Pelethousia sp.]
MRTDLINWSRFEQCNSANLTSAFENMCRMQFNRFFFDGKAILTSSPNNPGIEVEPVLHLSTNKHISFQAKYFTSNIDYGSIERSMKAAIMNYSGKLDVIYLYCNKDFAYIAPSFVRFKNALCAANICLIAVTNAEILNQIIGNRYLVIAARYFQNESINADWFAQKVELSLSELEPRYTRGFNVEVEYEQQLSLFAFMQGAIDYLNNKRAGTIKGIKDLRPFLSKYWDFIDETIIRLKNISDINSGNALDCLGWYDLICEGRNFEIRVMEQELDELISKVHSEKNANRRNNLLNERTYLERFLNALYDIRIDETERRLLQSKVLILKGNAGTGKSHLLGTFSKMRIDSGDPTILLLGQTFLSDHPVEQQILENLGLNYFFDELLDILDGMGIEGNRQVIIIIDSINESTNKDIWKSSLSRIFDKIETCQNVRLILSIRTGYERLTFTDAVTKYINDGSASQIVHYGFADNTIEATMQFFDYYKIPFGASDLLQHEFSNPLMLKLYCETRKSNPASLFDDKVNYFSHK